MEVGWVPHTLNPEKHLSVGTSQKHNQVKYQRLHFKLFSATVLPTWNWPLEGIFSRVAPLMIFIVVIIVDQTIDDIWENRSVSFSVPRTKELRTSSKK